MTQFNLDISRGACEIVIEGGVLEHIGKWVQSIGTPPVVVICSDTTVASMYFDQVAASLQNAGVHALLHTIEPGDESKNINELTRIYDCLADARCPRDGLLLALGGGVVSDLTGFAAATWMRGIDYITCPTTLEADVDAAIGGKTAVNHTSGKNLIGAFHHARLIVVDPQCLRTLPARDISSGLAESVKHALIADSDFLDWHERLASSILAVEPATMAELVERNMRIKANVVEQDEKEHGLRAILNFGHTIGHAIESWFSYGLRHGEAVSIGMAAAAFISREEGLLAEPQLRRIRSLLQQFALPIKAPHPFDLEEVHQLTYGDKKVKAGKRRWVLLNGLGETVITDKVSDSLVREAIQLCQP